MAQFAEIEVNNIVFGEGNVQRLEEYNKTVKL